MRDCVIGLDLGASTLKAGLFEADFEPVSDIVRPTPDQGPDAIVESLAEVVRELAATVHGAVSQIGIGTPGLIDGNGIIHGPAVNIGQWQGTSLSRLLHERTGIPCVAGNDVNFAALAEARRRNCKDLLFVSLGTGLGGGIVSGGRLITGTRGMAGELGHVVVVHDGPECGCGQRGCLERYVGAPSLMEAYRTESGRPLRDIAELAQQFRNRDPVALNLLTTAARLIARAVGYGLSLVAPQVVVIGGGVAEALPELVLMVDSALAGESFPYVRSQTRVEPSLLGRLAGMAGAAIAAREATDSPPG